MNIRWNDDERLYNLGHSYAMSVMEASRVTYWRNPKFSEEDIADAYSMARLMGIVCAGSFVQWANNAGLLVRRSDLTKGETDE